MSPEVVKYTFLAVVDYLGGNYKEYERMANKAMDLNIELPKLVSCLYKVGGTKTPAYIDFATGVITDLEGNILRRGKVC